MNSPEHIDYLAIGHICHDLTSKGRVIGGAAAYGTAMANVLGCRTAVVTSSAPEDDWHAELPNALIHDIPASQTTLFENEDTPNGRVQTIHAVADRISSSHIPAAWQRASIVHVGPIANEVDPRVVLLFSNSVVGLAPQGWLRLWDADGHITSRRWSAAAEYLRLAAAVFISEEDLLDSRMLDEYRLWSRLLVVTQGPQGCTLYVEKEARHFPVASVPVVDTTGAGDIFAAAFLVRLYQTGGSPSAAAQFANKVASLSIGFAGLREKMAVIGEALAEK